MEQRNRVEVSGSASSVGSSAAAAGAPSTERSAADYLKRHSVTLIMHDLLAVLLENRPADPIDFISDYFANVAQKHGGEPIERCCRYIRLSNPGTKTFMDNLAAAYATLDLHHGLTTSRLAELIRYLCQDLPFEVVTSVLYTVESRPTERVSFADFVGTIRATLMYREFVAHAETVFRACVADSMSGMSTRVFLALVKQTQALMDPAHSETCEQVLGKIPLPSTAATGSTNTQSSSATDTAALRSGPVSFDEFITALLRAAAAKTLPRRMAGPGVTEDL